MKCFVCGERGHVVARRPKKKEIVKSNCLMLQSNKSCIKEVRLDDANICALLDTGSDISLICEAKYHELNLPLLIRKPISFRGVGVKDNQTLGFFETNIRIDDHIYKICVHVIPSKLMLHELLLGTAFTRQVELNVKGGDVRITPIENEMSEVLNIQVINEIELNNPTLADQEHREKITRLVVDYVPKQLHLMLKYLL